MKKLFVIILMCFVFFCGCGQKKTSSNHAIIISDIDLNISGYKNDTEPISLGKNDSYINYIQESLEKEDVFVFKRDTKNKGVLKIESVVAPDSRAKLLKAIIYISLKSNTILPLKVAFEGSQKLKEDNQFSIKEAEDLFKKSLSEALIELAGQAKLVVSSDDKLFEALKQGDVEEKIAAVYLFGEKKNHKAVSPICEIIKNDPPEELWDACLSAFIQIGDKKSAPCIINSIGSDNVKLLKSMEALVVIGGDDSLQYLEMVSDGHDEEKVRNFAQKMLERLKQRNNKNINP